MNEKKKAVSRAGNTASKKLRVKVPKPQPKAGGQRERLAGERREGGKKSRARGKTALPVRPATQRAGEIPNPTQVEYFKDIVATIREPLVVLDDELRVLSANRSYYKYFKVKAGETVGARVYDLGNRQWDIPALRNLLETILPKKAVFNGYEVTHDFPLIGKRSLLLNARRIPAPPKEGQWILLAFEDVSERMRLEKSLQASEERFRRAFETAHDGMLLVEKTGGQIVNSNQSAEESLGYSKHALLKKNLWELGILKDENQFRQTSLELEEQGMFGLPDMNIPTRRGGSFPADVNFMDRAAVIQCNIRNIGERKQSEERRRESSKHLNDMISNSPTIIYSLRVDGDQVNASWVSENIRSILGFSPEDPMKPDWWLEHVHPEDRANARMGLEHLFDDNYHHEYRFHCKDGRLIWLYDEHRLLRDADNKPREIIGIWTDITERKQADKVLRESEDKFKHVFEYANVGNSITQVSGEISVNRTFCAMLGYSPKELESKKWQEVTHPDDIALTQREIDRMLSGEKESVRFIKRYLKKDGSVVWADISSSVRRDETGKPLYFMTSLIDITQQKQAEEALFESKEKLTTLFELLPVGVSVLDAENKIAYLNPALTKILDIPREGLNGGDYRKRTYLRPNGTAMPADEFASNRVEQEQQAVYNVETGVVKEDGKVIWTNVSAAPVNSADWKTIIVTTDITEQKQAEEALRRQAQIMDQVHEGIVATDLKGRISSWNPGAERLLGYSAEEVLGKPLSMVYPPDQLAFLTEEVQPRVRAKGWQETEVRLLHKSGKEIPVHLMLGVLRDSNGKVVGNVGSAIDISGQKQAQALQEAVYRIAAVTETTPSLDELYPQIHQIVSSVMPAENFYIAIYDKERDLLRFPYIKDAEDEPFMGTIQPGKGVTAYVLRTGKSLLGTQAAHEDLERRGEVILLGVQSAIWLGVPLIVEGKTIGVMAVQHYSDPEAYGVREQHMLEFVSSQVAHAIHRKQAEEALHESEQRLASIYDTVGDSLFYLEVKPDEQYRFSLVNPAFYKVTGLTSEQVLGKKVNEVIPELSLSIVLEKYRQAIEGKSIVRWEEISDYPTGRLVGEVSVAPVFDEAGTCTHLVGSVHDVTERKRSERLLNESREELRLITDNMQDMVIRTDLEGVILYASPSHESVLGVKPEEMVGESIYVLMHPEEVDRVRNFALDSLQDKTPGKQEFRYRRTDGHYLWLESSGAIIFGEDGSPAGAVFSSHDISERKRAEEALRTLSTRQEAILDAVPDILMEVDNDKRYTWANPTGIEFFGEDVVGKGADFYFEGEQDTYGAVRPLFNGNEDTMYVESWQRRKDGVKRLLAWNCRVIKNKAGEVSGALSSAHDITERKQAEDSLLSSQRETVHANRLLLALSQAAQSVQLAQKTEEVYSAIQDQISDMGYYVTGFELLEDRQSLQITYLNYKEDLVRKGEKVTGLSLRDFHFRPHEGSVYQRILHAGETIFMADGAQAVADTLPKRLHGLARPVADLFKLDQSIFAPLQAGEEIIGVLGFTGPDLTEADTRAVTAFARQASIAMQNTRLYEQAQKEISERKRAENKLQEYSDHLEDMVDERTHELRETQERLIRHERLAVLGQLAGSVGHELRNPLGVINTAIYYLKLAEPEASGKIKEHLGMIEQEVHNADKIIGDLLDFARGITAERERVAVAEVVQKVLTYIPAPPAVQVKLEIPADLPMVYADPHQMGQVLDNLIINACQAMVTPTGSLSPSAITGAEDKGKVTISASVEKDMVAIAVKDNGTGITPENMKKLFEPLFTTKAKGIGLGLAVSKKLAEANGGRIEVKSEAGKGSTFTLVLPMK